LGKLDRRSTLGLGAALIATTAASARATEPPVAEYWPPSGEEMPPGVRELFISRCDVALSTYQTFWMTDLILEPGATTHDDMVPNDMLMVIQKGYLDIQQNGRKLHLHPGHLWAVPKGASLHRINTSSDSTVVRVIDLLEAW
jgi:uncharacterized cupin superfamily protein